MAEILEHGPGFLRVASGPPELLSFWAVQVMDRGVGLKDAHVIAPRPVCLFCQPRGFTRGLRVATEGRERILDYTSGVGADTRTLRSQQKDGQAERCMEHRRDPMRTTQLQPSKKPGCHSHNHRALKLAPSEQQAEHQSHQGGAR